MIFLGDIAHPFSKPPHWGQESTPWASQPVIVNLEGALNSDLKLLNSRRLFNHPSVLDAFECYSVAIASLANNHVMDVPDTLAETISALAERGIDTVGAGANRGPAATAARLCEGGRTCILLSYGWKTIRCEIAGDAAPGVNALSPYHVLDDIRRHRARSPSYVIVVIMHWNYEMELYPQPAHRQLAMAAIEAGADAVVGHHPHRVGGIEFHRDKMIAYSVGNWWLPQGVFFNGALRFEDDALLELALEWRPEEPPICHWFQYNPAAHRLQHTRSEPATESLELAKRTPFAGVRHDRYRAWFAQHRVKRKLLPIYSDFRSTTTNAIKDQYVQWRHSALVAVENSGLRDRLGI